MLDHEGNTIEKDDRKSYLVDALFVPEKIQCADFMGEVETRFVNINLEDSYFHCYSPIL